MLPGLPSSFPGRLSLSPRHLPLTLSFSTLAYDRVSIHSKGLTILVTPLFSTLTKNVGESCSPHPASFLDSARALPLFGTHPGSLHSFISFTSSTSSTSFSSSMQEPLYLLSPQELPHSFRHNRGVPPRPLAAPSLPRPDRPYPSHFQPHLFVTGRATPLPFLYLLYLLPSAAGAIIAPNRRPQSGSSRRASRSGVA